MMARRSSQLIAAYSRARPDQLPELLAEQLVENPRCPVTRYLLGCHCLDRGRTATAVRHMMVAHHVDPQLESAALLVFAGLNWINCRGASLLPVLLNTWDEFRRPEFDRQPRERRLLGAFAEEDPGLERVSMLARRLWRLPIRTLRAQIRSAVVSKDTGLYSLLSAPA